MQVLKILYPITIVKIVAVILTRLACYHYFTCSRADIGKTEHLLMIIKKPFNALPAVLGRIVFHRDALHGKVFIRILGSSIILRRILRNSIFEPSHFSDKDCCLISTEIARRAIKRKLLLDNSLQLHGGREEWFTLNSIPSHQASLVITRSVNAVWIRKKTMILFSQQWFSFCSNVVFSMPIDTSRIC